MDHNHFLGLNFNPLYSVSMQLMSGYLMRPKIELPKFDDETKQSMAWINKVEESFCIQKIIADDEKIKHASMHLKFCAYNQYMWWNITTKVCSYNWNTLKTHLFKIFQYLTKKAFFAQIIRLQQKGVWRSTLTNGNP